MSAKPQQNDGSNGSETNDITRAYQMMSDLEAVADRWEVELNETGGDIGAKVTGSSGPTGTFHRGWWDGEGSVEVGTTFTIPMDVPAWMIEQMKAEFRESGATVDIDMSTSVWGRPPKQKESGVVVPRGPSQERIDAMDESEKTHTGKVEVTLDVTDEMQGIPDGMIIEGSRVSHSRLGEGFVKSIHGSDPDHIYIVPEDQEQMKGRVASVDPGSVDLLEQFPEETEESGWWRDV